MSQTFSENFESGTPGATVTTSNTTFATVAAPPAGGTFAFDATHVAHGSQSAKVATGATAGQPHGIWNFSDGSTQQWFRSSLYFTAYPSFLLVLAYVSLAAGGSGTRVCRFEVSSAGKLGLEDTSAGVHTFGSAIPLNAWFRVEGWVTGNAAAGQLSLSRFDSLDSVTPTETYTSAANRNTAGAPVAWLLGGFQTSQAGIGPFWTDDAAASSAGPLGPASPPSGNAAGFLPFL